jgi:type VI secretion system protein ImpJ
MAMQIHWQEGLFLQPHHLQRMQKGFGDQVAQERRLGWPYPYGLIEARISRDELENFRIRFDKLRLIMPSGLELNYPENAELPSLDIKQAFSRGTGAFSIAIGVPLWQNARANTLNGSHGGDSRVKLIYRIAEIECTDENTGDNPKPIQVRKINARLMFENDDASDMELLPLLRITRGAGEEGIVPKQDPEFVAPCLVLGGSPVLREMVRDLVNQIESSRKAQVVKMTRGGFSVENMRGVQFVQMLKLGTLNRFSARLPSLIAATVTPFAMYLELRELLAELAALHPDRDKFESVPYNHDSPFLPFTDLSAKIREALIDDMVASFMKVDFKEINGVLTAQLTDEQVTQPNAYFLGVRSNAEPAALGRLVETPERADTPDKFKLMPTSLITRAVRGIVLKEERHPPLELPAASDLHYFRLDRAASARMWDQVKAEKSASVRWMSGDVDLADAKFTLYMTTPNLPSKT